MDKVVDSILRTLSQNFQRATLKPVLVDGVELWVVREEGVEPALEHVRESLKVLVVGFDREVDSFVGRLGDEVRFKPPESMNSPFLFHQFAVWLGGQDLVVSVPVVRKGVCGVE